MQLEQREGVWAFTEQTRVVADEAAADEGRKLALALSDAFGRPLSLVSSGGGREDITLVLDNSRADLGEEGYELLVAPAGVRMTARAAAGLFYAGQTFRQLLPPAAWRRAAAPAGADWQIQGIRILDRPRFSWRGLLLDPARHFIPKAVLFEMLDAMAMHKMNRLQLHLTDDQGWRIEIRAFPRLTARSSWRSGTLLGHLDKEPHQFSTVPHGGFYSQDDLREIVAYAKARHIVVIPEIEMPGHARAWLSAYPEFAVFPERAANMDLWQRWGVSKDVLAPRPATLEACRRILDEVCDIFPSTWIHTGGDEAPRDQWNESSEIQNLIKSLGLKNADELQAWFTAELSRYLAGKGRRLVGWDEILAGAELGGAGAKTALHPSAVVHSWRGEEGGLAAAKAGHDAIMSPYRWTYLDYRQGPPAEEPLAIGGSISLARTFAYEPVPAGLPEAASVRILGGQTQVWAEYLPGFEAVAYMTFPRASALAEVFWSPREGKELSDFLTRLEKHEKRLLAAGIHHRALARRTSWPQASGQVLAEARDAVIHGTEISRREDGALAGWKNPETLIAWRVQLPAPGRYRLALLLDPASGAGGSVEAMIAGTVLPQKERHADRIGLGAFEAETPGPHLLFLRGTPGAAEFPIIKGVQLEPSEKVLFFDDFEGPELDTTKWVPGLHQWGPNNRGVVPENLSLRTVNDEGRSVTVLDTEAHGDLYRGPVKGIKSKPNGLPLADPGRYERVEDGTRVGGLVWTKQKFGPGRYEVRMKNLPLPGGCSCIWNYYEGNGDYTEIDIEMPANGKAEAPNWSNWAGLNTYYPGPEHINEKVQDTGAPQNDGRFHVYRWDWYDGTNGPARVEFYVDGHLLHTSTSKIPKSPAQLWVGNWPAVWSGHFRYDIQHLFVDWVKITALDETTR